jgi:hypothetical protein
MPCQINNSSNIDMSSLEPHVQGMYDYFDQKIGFEKPPTMHFDSDPSNQSNVLGKTAYYDPSSLEIHIFTDGRHPKDMLRSIAHELIHHQQNLEGRLNVGGYMGQGYYLQNEKMRALEQEAMLEGNATLREYEDTIKSEEINEMSLKEWKNNELNGLLLKKFGILKEAKEELAVQDGPGTGKDNMGITKSGKMVPNPGGDGEKSEDEKMNEEVVEEETELQEMDRGDEDAAFAQAMGDKEQQEKARNQMAKERKPSGYPGPKGPGRTSGAKFSRPLQETLKRLAKAKNITLRSSGKKIK